MVREVRNSRTVWQYLAAGDRETFVAGILAWLMDPSGNHGLKNEILNAALKKAGRIVSWQNQVTVIPELRADSARRFDIALHDGAQCVAVFEVKCKTFGTLEQLERYKDKSPFVARIGFAEWNWELSDQDKHRFPLVRLGDLSKIIRRASHGSVSALSGFLFQFSDYLAAESDFLQSLRDYYIGEITTVLPTNPTLHKYSQRFYNQLYWRWFLEKSGLKESGWHTKSEASGVWCSSGGGVDVTSEQVLNFPRLGLRIPGPCSPWIHIELFNKEGLLREVGSVVGSIQLRIEKDHSRRDETYELLAQASNLISVHGFRPPSRRPASTAFYYRALQRDLRLAEFRISKLQEVVDLLSFKVE